MFVFLGWANGNDWQLSLMDSIGQKEKLEDVEDLGARDDTLTAEAPKNVERLVVVLSTDRGLCGGAFFFLSLPPCLVPATPLPFTTFSRLLSLFRAAVNSSLARVVRSYLGERIRMGEEVKLFMLGEKARVQIGRDYGRIAVGAIDSAFDKDPIFPLAASIGEQILQQPFDELTLFYNHFENTAKFNNAVCNIEQLGKLKAGEMPKQFEGYDVEPDNVEETMLNLMEYSVAGTVYYTMLESQACEVSQRVAAMDNATNNAKDMVDRFTLQYNRARQAKITTELTEIISGAESLNEE